MPRLDNLQEAVEAEIGERIRVRRSALGMSQAELADRIGMSFQQVQKYERGANRIASSILVRVADALGCAPGELLTNGRSRGRASSAIDREIDAVASRIKMLKSTAARKKILGALGKLLSEAESAAKAARPAIAKAKARSKPAPTKKRTARKSR